MKVVQYRICAGSVCESYTKVACDIERKLGLENVTIDPETGKISYDNPKNCHVDEKLLEEAAKHPDRKIEFEVCE